VNTFHVGALVELSTEVRDRTGELADPATIRLLVRNPDGTVDEYTPTPDDVGLYHTDIEVQAPGFWRYRWETTGDPTAVSELVFYVRKRRVPDAS
jgi:hypothetical protein